MDEPKETFERFFKNVVIMSFDLLHSLEIEDIPEATGQAVHIIIFDGFLVFNQFLNEPEVAACSTDIRVDLHLSVHFEDGIIVRSDSNINEKGILWLQLLTKTIEEPVVRVQASCFLVLDAEEKIDIKCLGTDSPIFIQSLPESLPFNAIVHPIRIQLTLDITVLLLSLLFLPGPESITETGSRQAIN